MAGSGRAHLRDREDLLLRVEGLVVEYSLGAGRTVRAVSDVSLDVARGETLGLVGESGCGKSTTGRAIVRLTPSAAGSIWFDGHDLTTLDKAALRRKRTRMQMIFQDPISSLNPRRTVGRIVSEPLRVWGPNDATEQASMSDEMLEAVGLDPTTARDRYPHQFSGGQCQRISIARALITEPELLVCDEPVSALDVSVQAQILNMLEDLKHRYHLTMIFIAHDLAVVKNISDRVAVMYLGKLCEVADSDTLYSTPAHPYTALLLASSPVPDPAAPLDTEVSTDDLPSPINPPPGCRFHTRCPRASERCRVEEPTMRRVGDGDQFVACHHPLVDMG